MLEVLRRLTNHKGLAYNVLHSDNEPINQNIQNTTSCIFVEPLAIKDRWIGTMLPKRFR